MFKFGMWDLKNYTKMFTNCPVCGLKYEIETGFFWGSMYVSYAMSVAMCFIVCGPIFFLFDPDVWVYIVAIISALLISIPFMFRFARILLLHFTANIRHDSSYAVKVKD